MFDTLKPKYDVIICGAGPAGLMAARTLVQSQRDLKIALLDKRLPWREPVACAEAVATSCLQELVPLDSSWIRQRISGICFVSPNGTKVDYRQQDSGLILDRAAFHQAMAEWNHEKGVHCHFQTEVVSLSPSLPEGWVVTVKQPQGVFTLEASVVVDASGPGGKLTRGIAGFDSLENGAYDLEPAVFCLATGIPHRADTIELYFGEKRFPGGYGWVFPRDGQTANVGIVIGRSYLDRGPVRELLKQWIQENWPTAQCSHFFGGSIACGQSSKAMACKGLFKAGDSASGVNPISRSGIIEAMKAGQVVGKVVPQWLDALPEQRVKMEQQVLDQWMLCQGKSHLNLSKAKRGFYSISDSVLDRAAHKLSILPEKKRTLFRIFLHTLFIAPSLLWKMRSMMR